MEKVKQKPNPKSKLYKALYNAARRCMDPQFRNDGEAIRIKRDHTCYEMFDRPYDELAVNEILDVINELDVQSGATTPAQVKIIASKKQLKLLRFYQICVALHYYDFDGVVYLDDETDFEYSGEELRNRLIHRFEENKGFLPYKVYRLLYERYINPKSHKFLIEGGYKRFVKNENVLRYEYLRPQEVQYLIKRYQAIYNNIEMANNILTQALSNINFEN